MAENLDAERMCLPVCRLCLGKEEDFVPIFDDVELPSKMKYCIEVEASPTDGLTNVICLSCLENVERFFNFKKMCADSQLQLRKNSKESDNSLRLMIVPGSISSGEKANENGVDWSTEETRKSQEIGDSVSSTSAEEYKSAHGRSADPLSNDVYFQEQSGLNSAEPLRDPSEGSEVGEWDDTDNAEGVELSGEHAASRREHAGQGVSIKHEVTNEGRNDDFMMSESFNSAEDENGEMEETEEASWEESSALNDDPASVKTTNSEPTDNLESEKIHVCKYCNLKFAKRHQLYGHLATHTKKGHHHPKTTTSRSRSAPQYNSPPAKTRAWLAEQQSQMKFACIDCNQSFTGVDVYTSHKGIHRQADKKFHCSVCGHVYPRAIDLIFHEWTYHTGDRPFPCNRCPSAFARQTSWTYHVLAHIGKNGKSPSRNVREVASVQSPPKKAESPPKSEIVTRRTVAPRKAALEGRAAAQMGAVAASAGNFPFKCRTCGKGISSEETWEYHLVIHPDGGETRQKLPPKDLENLRTQLRQILVSEEKAKLGCLHCGLELIGLQGLADHKMLQHQSVGGYRCSVCYKGIENVHRLIRHEMSHTKVKIYSCEKCGREMSDRMTFVRHIIAHSNENQYEVPSSSNINSQAKLRDAAETKDVKENNFELMVEKLLGPIQERLKQELSPCLQCGQVFEGVHRCEQKFSAKDEWMNHLQTHFLATSANTSKALPQPSVSPYGKRPRKASSDASTPAPPAKVASTGPSSSSSALRPYACGQCKSIFSNAESLEAHAVEAHGLVHPFKCKICGKEYRLLLRLMHHESSVHPQLMGHPCEYCDKSFSDASHLKLHCLLIHGDGPYMCDICGKRFRMVGHLKIHRNMHTSGKDKKGKPPSNVGQASTSAMDELEYSEFDVFD
ncbi:hypothetical protein J437_LFUL004363 [Ladona fulva]|uniref:Zinc finger protein n=1 Tax=Ladona fulva TaxID=123851 RepID=A0A8K0K5S7_LADFU|nr:hypothetical protein J437_LFUL004363 [Ladona fulva]